jgi:hypothetical protein
MLAPVCLAIKNHESQEETTMSKKFASQADLTEKKVSFDKLSDNAYAYTAEGDPNTGVIIGDDGVMVIERVLRAEWQPI